MKKSYKQNKTKEQKIGKRKKNKKGPWGTYHISSG